MSVEHRTIRVEREYPHHRSSVFAAWSDSEIKRRWFDLSEGDGEWCSDFRTGGLESYRSSAGRTPRLTYTARHCDIVPGERIVLTTEVTLGERLTSVTVTTAEFDSTPAGTLVRVTEQAAVLDELEDEESRTAGLTSQLKRLAAQLACD